MTFSIGQALSESFAITSRRFGAKVAVSLLVTVLTYALVGAYVISMIGGVARIGDLGETDRLPALLAGAFGIGAVLLGVVVIALVFLGQAAICVLSGEDGARPIGDALAAGLRAVPTLLGITGLFIIGMIGLGVVVAIGFAGLMVGARSPLVVVLSAVMLLGGGAYLYTKLSLILPVVVFDGERGPLKAVGRSWNLSRGNTARLFAFYLIVLVLVWIAAVIVQLPTGGTFGLLSRKAGAGFIAAVIVAVAVNVVQGIYLVAVVTAAHRQLAGPEAGAVAETFA